MLHLGKLPLIINNIYLITAVAFSILYTIFTKISFHVITYRRLYKLHLKYKKHTLKTKKAKRQHFVEHLVNQDNELSLEIGPAHRPLLNHKKDNIKAIDVQTSEKMRQGLIKQGVDINHIENMPTIDYLLSKTIASIIKMLYMKQKRNTCNLIKLFLLIIRNMFPH